MMGNFNLSVKKSMLALISMVIAVSVSAKDISQDELIILLKSDNKPVVIDVRTAGEYADGHVPGAINIPHKELVKRLAEISQYKDKDIVLYCRSGKRADIAKNILTSKGFTQLAHLEGDYLAWDKSDLPVDKDLTYKQGMKKLSNPCGF